MIGDRKRIEGTAIGRRAFLGTIPAVGAWMLSPAHAAAPERAGRYDSSRLPSEEQLGQWLRMLHAMGPVRPAGTPAARQFEDWIAETVAAMGFSVERQSYRLTAWECDLERDCAVMLHENGGGDVALPPVAYYPYAASTRGREPAVGTLLHAGTGEESVAALVAATAPDVLARSIVVVDLPVAAGGSRILPEFYPESFPAELPPAPAVPSPSSQVGKAAMEAVDGKCRGLVLCYTNVSDDAARYTYLPFDYTHRPTPALWIGRESAARLRAAPAGSRISLRCDAVLTPDAHSDTLIATLPGMTDEVMLLTTQTDGPNEVNENGALGLIALAGHAAAQPREQRRRTLVLSFPTGHYAIGAIADPVTGSGQLAMTHGVVRTHPEMIARVKAHIALEQLGAMDWQDMDNGWQATGLPAREFWHVTPGANEPLRRIFTAATRGLDPRWSRSSVIRRNFPPGEGGALRALGIPGFGLLGVPAYFFRADPRGVIDKTNPRVMRNQVEIATRMMVLMDGLRAEQLRGEEPITQAELML